MRSRLASMLKIYMDLHGLTQQHLSQHTGISPPTICRFLSGEREALSLKDFNKLLNFLTEPSTERFRI